MNAPLVSVVIPVFNRFGLIGECVESALAQSYRNIEVIVSDNCSTDGTQEIVRHYTREDQRVSLLESPTNCGPVRNWLRGLQAAKGTYCKLLFSDDLLHPTAIEKQVQAMGDGNVEAAFSSASVGSVPWAGDIFYKIAASTRHLSGQEYVFRSLIRPRDYPVSPCAFLFYRERYTAVLDSLATVWAGDADIMKTGAGIDLLSILEYLTSKGRVTYLGEPLVFFRAHQNSITINNMDHVKRIYHEARYRFVRDRFGPDWEKAYRCLVRSKSVLTEWRTRFTSTLLSGRD